MLATFRNIAVIVVTWYVCSFAGGLLAYGAQFPFGVVVGDSERPGSAVLMHLVAGLPGILLSLLAGAIGAAAIRPKGETKWVIALAALFRRYVGSAAMAYPMGDWDAEEFIGIILVAGLLVGGVFFGASIIRKRAQTADNSRVQPT